MSTFIDSVIILSSPTSASDVFKILTRYFEENGIVFEPDSSVIFNDLAGKEKEPEIAFSEEEALSNIISWPGLGGTEYSMLGLQIPVFLHGTQPHLVDFVTLSVSNRPYSSNVTVHQAFDRMTERLHKLLQAKRTISGFELLSPGSWISDEVKRVRCGVFEGEYASDLRT